LHEEYTATFKTVAQSLDLLNLVATVRSCTTLNCSRSENARQSQTTDCFSRATFLSVEAAQQSARACDDTGHGQDSARAVHRLFMQLSDWCKLQSCYRRSNMIECFPFHSPGVVSHSHCSAVSHSTPMTWWR